MTYDSVLFLNFEPAHFLILTRNIREYIPPFLAAILADLGRRPRRAISAGLGRSRPAISAGDLGGHFGGNFLGTRKNCGVFRTRKNVGEFPENFPARKNVGKFPKNFRHANFRLKNFIGLHK